MINRGQLAVLFVFLIAFTGFVVANDSLNNLDYLIQKEFSHKITDDLLDYFSEDDSAEVVITLRNEKHFDSVVRRIGEEKITDTVGREVIAAKITKAELYELLQQRRIKYIEPQRIFLPSLYESVDLVGVREVWDMQIENQNLDGTGQTILIIDSGVDFSHPALGPKNALAGRANVDCANVGTFSPCVINQTASDTFGHGTHVAGIAAAAVGIDGIAKGSKIIGVKTFKDGEQVTTTTRIQKALKWAKDNAATYNVSVVSISLSTQTLYQSSCDSQFQMSQDINNLVSAGVAVVASTGNDASTSSISAPACISNAIAVTAADKEGPDRAPYANLNGLVKLVGIGGRTDGGAITSTKMGGGYEDRVGTSMATPMVSGAIAIVQQYLRLTNTQMTPLEIEDLLYNNGYSMNGYSQRVINVSNAIEEVIADTENPVVNLNYPRENGVLVAGIVRDTNGNLVGHNNLRFSCSATDNKGLSSIELNIRDSSDSVVYNREDLLTGQTSQDHLFIVPATEFESFPGREDYTWNCKATDTSGNSASAAQNRGMTLVVIKYIYGG